VAFLDINKKKLAFLLSNGTHEDELKRFFKDSRAQLILRGARMQNLPRTNTDRIRAICEQLPQRTDETLRDWFSRHISLSEPMSSEDAYTYLQLYFDQHEDIQIADRKLISRSALIYLFESNPNPEVLTFLQNPVIAPQNAVNVKLTEETPDQPISEQNHGEVNEPEATNFDNDQLSELLSAVIVNNESAIDDALTNFPFTIRSLVEGLLCARGGDIEAANNYLKMLDTNCIEAEYLKLAIGRLNTSPNAPTYEVGVKLRIPQQLSELPQTESYDIVGIYTNESEAGAIFARPLVLKVEDRVYMLSRDDRFALFPESGDVMTHRSEIRHQPKRGGLVYWRVSEKESINGRTRFRLDSELGPVLEVHSIPVPSHDPDEIRERIKVIASTGQLSNNQQAAFVLSDGIILLSSKTADITRDEAYDTPWQALDTMETWLIEGRQYCIDLSRNSMFNMDLSTPESYLKRVLKSLEAEQKASLTKAQRRELLELFREALSSDGSPRADRIISSLESVSLSEEDLESVLRLLNSREEVKIRAQEMFDDDYAKLKSQLSTIQIEIESLKRRKLQLKDEEKEIEARNKESVAMTNSLVEQAFSTSIQNGITTLANVEIFKTLTSSQKSLPTATRLSSDNSDSLIDTWIIEDPLSPDEALNRLISLGLNRRQAIVISQLSALVFSSGTLLILKGDRARHYAQILARINSTTTGLIEIPMGITSGITVRAALNTMPQAIRLIVLSADLSPLEIYGSRLLDTFYESASQGGGIPKPVILTCLGGEMCLPLPESLQQIAITIDLENSWDSGLRTLEEIEFESIPLLSSLRNRLFDNLGDLPPEYRDQVEKVLINSMSLTGSLN